MYCYSVLACLLIWLKWILTIKMYSVKLVCSIFFFFAKKYFISKLTMLIIIIVVVVIEQNPQCSGSYKCLRTCKCFARESALTCLVNLYNYQIHKGEEEVIIQLLLMINYHCY